MASGEREYLGLRYLIVADILRKRVLAGEYQPGERMPRQHELAKELNVSFITLKQALDILEGEGYVVRKVGQGTYASLPEEHKPVALVVDDDLSIRRFFLRVLARNDWEGTAVESGQVALEKLNEQQFDLIFLDLVLAGMNGADTFRQIRTLYPESTVVIITGYPDSALMSEVLQIGPFAVMSKPISMDDLNAVLTPVANSLKRQTVARPRAWTPS